MPPHNRQTDILKYRYFSVYVNVGVRLFSLHNYTRARISPESLMICSPMIHMIKKVCSNINFFHYLHVQETSIRRSVSTLIVSYFHVKKSLSLRSTKNSKISTALETISNAAQIHLQYLCLKCRKCAKLSIST